MTDQDTITRLTDRIESQAQKTEKLDAYFEGEQRLAALGLALPRGFERLMTVVNWTRLVVLSLEERLDLEHFRTGGSGDADDRLQRWWEANRLASESSLGHTEALVQGEAYIAVGFNELDPSTPLYTVESRHTMTVETDRRTKLPREGLRLLDKDPDTEDYKMCVLYLLDRTSTFEKNRGRWVEIDRNEHGMNRLPVVPLLNRARIKDRCGRSEMADIIPITDAACRTLTNLQGAQEFLAIPQRYILGATEKDFVGSDGTPKTSWEVYIGNFLALANENAKFGQLPAADLRNFTQTVDHYARIVGALSGLPPHYLGFTSDNPASADAIRSSEARLVKRAERVSLSFGDSWEEAMRVGMLLVDGELSPDAQRIEAVWRNPATPTYAAKADAVTKLYTANGPEGPLLPREAAWEELGYSPAKRRRLLEMSSDDPAVRYLAATDGRPVIPDDA